jgi:hypothetical protein
MAAATKLNPAAPPFYGLHLAPPPPPPFPLADAAACPTQFPFVTYCCVAAAPPAGRISFFFPVQQPPSSPPAADCKRGVPAAAAVLGLGRPPHKLMAAFSGLGGTGKRHAAASLAAKPWRHGPAPTALATAAAPAHVPAAAPRKPRAARRKVERSMAKPKPKTNSTKAKAQRPRKAAGTRARAAAKAQRESSPPPTTQYTTPRPRFGKRLPEPELGWTSHTVMFRNIPNRLRYALDQQRSQIHNGGVLFLFLTPN